jgi:hypothetical protein
MRCRSAAGLSLAVASLMAGCSGGSDQTDGASGEGIEGSYSMSATSAEIEAAPRHGADLIDNWGSFTLVLRDGRFRFSDHRPRRAEPSVGCRTGRGVCPRGTTTGRYVIRGRRIEFRQDAGSGDTPMGQAGDLPIVCRWSLYRRTLTFRLITDLPPTLDAGPPLLYVKPWRRLS